MAKNKKDVIVILWDYTESCELALLHGIQIAKEVNNHVMLARFIEKPGFFSGKATREKMVAEEKEKLKAIGQRIFQDHQINPFITVELGISGNHFVRLVRDANANLVICGKSYHVTEKLVFKAMDLVIRLKGLDIPFIVAQDKPAHSYYKEIVVPLDHDKTFKETLHWVVYLSKYYNCNINIIKPFIEDESVKKDMDNNIYFTKKTLDKKSVIYGIKTAKKNKAFQDEVLKFAENIDSDLIVMMVKKYQYFIKTYPDYQDKIPIMVVNRNGAIIKYGGFR